MTDITIPFTPKYLKELRQLQSQSLECLIEYVKEKILEANSAGEERIELAFKTNSPWRLVLEHFRELGFYAESAGYIEDQYDSNCDQIYCFIFNWYIHEEEDQ